MCQGFRVSGLRRLWVQGWFHSSGVLRCSSWGLVEGGEYVLWRRKMWKAKGWGIMFVGDGDDEDRVSVLLMADNCWIGL